VIRRFAPPGGFICRAWCVEFVDGVFIGFRWDNEPPRPAGCEFTIAEAESRVRRGTWRKLPVGLRSRSPVAMAGETLRFGG